MWPDGAGVVEVFTCAKHSQGPWSAMPSHDPSLAPPILPDPTASGPFAVPNILECRRRPGRCAWLAEDGFTSPLGARQTRWRLRDCAFSRRTLTLKFCDPLAQGIGAHKTAPAVLESPEFAVGDCSIEPSPGNSRDINGLLEGIAQAFVWLLKLWLIRMIHCHFLGVGILRCSRSAAPFQTD